MRPYLLLAEGEAFREMQPYLLLEDSKVFEEVVPELFLDESKHCGKSIALPSLSMSWGLK